MNKTEASEILGVPPDADPDTITIAYKRLARVTHPDKGGEVGSFQKVATAYATLLPKVCSRCNGTGLVTIRKGTVVKRGVNCPDCRP